MAFDSEGREPVVLSGPVTLYEVVRAREALMQMQAGGETHPVRIDLAQTETWDVAGLQLLIAAHRSAQARGVALWFEHVPADCLRLAERCGMVDWLGALARKA